MDAVPTSIDDLLERAVESGASDLHLVPGAPPTMRVHGDLTPLGAEKVMPDETRSLLYRILSTEQQKQLEVNRQLDFSYGVLGLARFRVNVHSSAIRSRPRPAHPGGVVDARGTRAAAMLRELVMRSDPACLLVCCRLFSPSSGRNSRGSGSLVRATRFTSSENKQNPAFI